MNISSLANDAGISVHTARGWLSILEASYIIYFLHPHFQNFSKRLIKSPKLYFYDTGIASALLGIQSKNDVDVHYLRGGLFESPGADVSNVSGKVEKSKGRKVERSKSRKVEKSKL